MTRSKLINLLKFNFLIAGNINNIIYAAAATTTDASSN